MTSRFVYLHHDIESKGLQKYDVGIIENNNSNDNISLIHFLRVNERITLPDSNVTSFDITETGDTFEHKVCDRCYKYLNTNDEFENNRHKKDNAITKRPSCRKCRRLKNGKSIPTNVRKEWESNRPQEGSLFTCPICKKTTIVGISKIVLDHNHHTGEVRGWLCESCNTGIGRFDDDPELIQRGIDWVAQFNRIS